MYRVNNFTKRTKQKYKESSRSRETRHFNYYYNNIILLLGGSLQSTAGEDVEVGGVDDG
jgi:hypothetical protein